MGLLGKIFQLKKDVPSKVTIETEQAVIVHFKYEIKSMESLYLLRDKLEFILDRDQLGAYDGHEMAIDYSDGFIYMYGPDAEALFNGIKEILEQTDFMKGAQAKLRFGPPEDGIKEITIEIGDFNRN